MSKQIQQKEREPQQLDLTREQVLAIAGTALASGVIDLATHNIIVAIVGGCAAMAAGVFTRPDVLRFFFPGSDPDKTVEFMTDIVEQIAPHEELPQDFRSKMQRLFGRPDPEQPTQPKGERPTIPVALTNNDTKKPAAPGTQRLAIPAAFTLDSIVDEIRAMNERGIVYFGRGGVDMSAALSLMDMYHVFDVSSSGSGKSNRFRLGMMQLVDYCETYYINPFANKVKVVTDSRKVEVWAPIFERLANGRPMKTSEEIKQLLQALIDEIQTRNDQEACDDFSWRDYPVFVFIDELPEIFSRCKEAPDMIDRIVRTGRQFGVFAWVASQSGAVADIGQSIASQAQYKTRIYGGGDRLSSSKLMKGPVPEEDEETLHVTKKGLTLMLAEGLTRRQFVRAPLVTNEALFHYFGLEFNLSDWYTPGASSPTRRSNVARTIATSGDHSGDHSQERSRRRIETEQAQEQKPAMTLDALMQLLQEDKIDLAMFQRLLDKIDITDADVSRPREEQPELRAIPSPVDKELEQAIEAYQNGAKTLDAMAAAFGDKSNTRARRLMPHVKRALGISV